ncbi:MAG: flagellar basal body-associated FliL family protein [Defluviitaleaceae bacterium]|nr:flagellar basal body-associated FliL family protein [Defluviitaleaceae bacterium]
MDKSKMMMIIIIALLVLLLGTVVGVGVYLINISDSNGSWDEPQQIATDRVLTPGDMRFVSLDQMVANLTLGPGGRSDNIVVTVEVGLNASETVDEDELEEFYTIFYNRIAIARSVAFDVFLSRTYDEVRTNEGRDETAEILKYALQEAFGSNLIVGVFFSEWNAVRGQVR